MEIKRGENPNPPRWTGVKKNTGTCNLVSVLAHLERGFFAIAVTSQGSLKLTIAV
jgi:hypothetical protein